MDENGVINEKDKQVIGDPNPDLTGSFFNRFTYKRFQLDVLCSYSIGNDVYNYMRQKLESMQGLWNQTQAVKTVGNAKGKKPQCHVPFMAIRWAIAVFRQMDRGW